MNNTYLNIIVFVESLKTPSLIEIFSHTHAENYARKKEGYIALTYALKYAIAVNVSPVNLKGQL